MNKAYVVLKKTTFQVLYLGTDKNEAINTLRMAIYSECMEEGWGENMSKNTADQISGRMLSENDIIYDGYDTLYMEEN